MTSLKNAMLAALADEDLHDIVLQGKDGIAVNANKAFLASRSPVFKRMLYLGNFAERNAEHVSVNKYCGGVLRALVKFCYTNELDLNLIQDDNKDNDINNIRHARGDGLSTDSDGFTDTEAIRCVQLREAAQYYELPLLHQMVTDRLGTTIAQKEHFGCVVAVLEELYENYERDGPLWKILMLVLKYKSKECLFPTSKGNKGIMASSIGLLFEILSQPIHQRVNAPTAAKCLDEWYAKNSEILEDPQYEKEKKELYRLARGIDLADIPATQLAEIKPSYLFPMKYLYEAFVKKQQESNETDEDPDALIPDYRTFVMVFGAGADDLNGVFHPVCHAFIDETVTDLCSGYSHSINENYFLVRRCPHSSWKLVLRTRSERIQGRVLYEPSEHAHGEDLPFASWKCCEGKDPAPYVAILKDVELTESEHDRDQDED